MIHQEKNPHIELNNQIAEDYLYHGSENPIIYKNTYEMDFHCSYDLSEYPFDHQTCHIEVFVRNNSIPFSLYKCFTNIDSGSKFFG